MKHSSNERSNAHCRFKQVVIIRTNKDVITQDVFMNENIVVETSAIAQSEEIDIEIEVEPKNNLLWYTNSSSVVKSTNDTLNGHKFVETIHRVYDKTVQWKKSFSNFLLGMHPKCSYGNSHHDLSI